MQSEMNARLTKERETIGRRYARLDEAFKAEKTKVEEAWKATAATLVGNLEVSLGATRTRVTDAEKEAEDVKQKLLDERENHLQALEAAATAAEAATKAAAAAAVEVAVKAEQDRQADNIENVAAAWCASKAGKVWWLQEATISFRCGQYNMQQQMLKAQREKAPLPEEMENPDPEGDAEGSDSESD